MEKDFNGLIIPIVVGISDSIQKNNLRNEVCWYAPEVGWVKVNFDGATRSNPSPSGIGCIV